MESGALVLVVGTVLLVSLLTRLGLRRLGVPALVGHVAIGFLLGVGDGSFGLLGESGAGTIHFLGTLGLFALLFHVGLESDLPALVERLPTALRIFVVNVTAAAACGWWASRALLDLSGIEAAFVAVALSATSVGLTVGAWEEAGALRTSLGELLLDVAELDDIVSVVLLAVLLALAPGIVAGGGAIAWSNALGVGLVIVVKLLAFGAACVLFARHVERRITGAVVRWQAEPTPMLVVVAVGFIIAASAELLGFSLAIGAFLAGIVFSRDPEAVKIDAAFTSLLELFGPFFFISVGLQMDPAALELAGPAVLILLVAAVVGKVAGAWLPAVPLVGAPSAWVLAVSMVPRAEIALVVIERGNALGIVSDGTFSAMVVVCLLTALGTPLVLRPMLARLRLDEAGRTEASAPATPTG